MFLFLKIDLCKLSSNLEVKILFGTKEINLYKISIFEFNLNEPANQTQPEVLVELSQVEKEL